MPQAPLLTRPYALLIFGQLLQAMGFSSMLLLPLYLEELGANREQIGFFHMTLAAFGGLLSRPLVAYSLDRLGRRPTLLAGTVCLAVGMALLAWVGELGPLLWVSRIIYGVGVGALFTGYFTAAADVIPASRRTEGIALFGIFGLLPMALNPVVTRAGIEPSDLPDYFLLLSGVIASSILVIWILPETKAARRPPVPGAPPELGVLAAVLARPLWPVWLATSTFASMVAVFMAFATVAARAGGAENPADIWFPYAAGAIAVRLFGARLPDRIGPANLVVPALGSYTLAMLVAAQGGHYLLAGLLAGLGHGYAFPVLTSQVVSRISETWRGTGLTVFTALWTLFEVTLTPGAGWVADLAGDAFMFCLVACGACVTLALWCVLEHRLAPRLAKAR